MQDNRSRQMSANIGMKPPTVQPHYSQRVQNDNLMVQQMHQNSSPRTPAIIEKINYEIKHLDQINRQLLVIAEKIKISNSVTTIPTNVPFIDRIQNDIHQSLQQLIQNIMEFFTDIDAKLKNVGFIVNNQLLKKNHIDQEKVWRNQETSTIDAKYQMLADRIKGLEISLKETQQNQKKLITVIQNLMDKYQINDQPTLIKDNPNLQNQLKRNRMATTSSANIHQRQSSKESQKLNQNAPNTFFKPQNKNKSIYQNLYTIQQSVVGQQNQLSFQPVQFRLRQIEKQDPADQVYIKKLYANNPYPPSHHLHDSKKSLRGDLHSSNANLSVNKQERSTASQASFQDDKQHRFNFLLGKLNNN